MNSSTIDKKGIFTLVLILSFMYFLNNITPMLNEDYFTSFVWPEGLPNLGPLPENTPKVSAFSEVLQNTWVYYFIEGGRVPGFIIRSVFSWLGKEYFNILNSLMFTILVMEIYWIQQEGKVSLNFRPSYLFWIFFSLWTFNVAFVDTCLWMSGSSDYLWMQVITLAFIIPFVRNYYNGNTIAVDSFMLTGSMFVLGLLAGWSNETPICWLIIVIFYWLFLCKKSGNLQQWKIAGFIGLCTGYALLIFAPGNFARLTIHMQQHINNPVMSTVSNSIKIGEFVWIALFHSFLWDFIIKFLCRHKNRLRQTKAITPYLNMAKACSMIALGSGIFMFLIPVPTIRPSFLNLVFLTIATALLFRAKEVAQECVIQQSKKSFLKTIGLAYFILTVVVCLWCNYNNWKQWNEVLAMIQREQENPTNTVLIVKPYDTDASIWTIFARGFHLIPMPVINGDDCINLNVARYYNLKGIEIEKVK